MNISELAYMTNDQPGVGGVLKQHPADFIVTEVPFYEPDGKGDHLYLSVEKESRLTSDCVRLLARHFRVSPYSVGYAGLKDKRAVTTQGFTIERGDPNLVASFREPNIRILWSDRTEHKLKRGILKGNRFIIKIRQVDPSKVLIVHRVMRKLAQSGVPNYFGEQRFGYRQDNHIQGRCLLNEDYQTLLDHLLGRAHDLAEDVNRQARLYYDQKNYLAALNEWRTVHRFERQALGPLSRGALPKNAVKAIDATHRGLLISAFQSEIFNRVLDQRVRDGTMDRLLPGDVAMIHESRETFTVQDPTADQPRCDNAEISPTGPMWGRNMERAAGQVAELETQALLKTGVTEQMLSSGEYTPDGVRRALRMLIHHPTVSAGADERGPYIEVQFELERGCYATVAMREIMKNSAAADSESGD